MKKPVIGDVPQPAVVVPEQLFESTEFKAALIVAVEAAVAKALQGSSVATVDGVKKYLDENLPDLVAAAMPETSEAKAERERQERAQASADAAAAKAEEQADKAEQDARAAEQARRERREKQEDAENAFNVDAWMPVGGGQITYDDHLIDPESEFVILADDGTTYCIDFKVIVQPKAHLDIHKDRGVLVKIPIEVGNLQERFKFARLTLRNANMEDGPILRCEIVQPFWGGEGRTADFPANSLLFRAIG